MSKFYLSNSQVNILCQSFANDLAHALSENDMESIPFIFQYVNDMQLYLTHCELLDENYRPFTDIVNEILIHNGIEPFNIDRKQVRTSFHSDKKGEPHFISEPKDYEVLSGDDYELDPNDDFLREQENLTKYNHDDDEDDDGTLH